MAGGMCRKEARAASPRPPGHPQGVREEAREWEEEHAVRALGGAGSLRKV